MWLQSLAAEFAITLADGTVWLSIGQGLLFGAVCLLFGDLGGSLRRAARAPMHRPARRSGSGSRPVCWC